ncbi:MAG: T9SS type A sorting domain-containing protein, partial [Bacteroidia bacterium]
CTTYDTIISTIYDTVTSHIYDTIASTIYDTLYTSVIDTLIINAVLTGINTPNNTNTLKIYPNPASTHITINNGNLNLMAGYTLTIKNNLGQNVFTSLINQQQFYLNLSTWTGNGIYFVHIIDSQSNTIEIKKIVLQ